MTSALLIVGGAVAVATAAATWPLTVAFSRLGLVSVPNFRSSHSSPTPSGVGIVVPVAVAVAVASRGEGLPLALMACLALGALGFIDDVVELPVAVRLGLQAVLAGVALVGVDDLSSWSFVPAVVAITAAVNGLNFMDGINGITAATGIVLGLSLVACAVVVGDSVWATVGMSSVGACLGYLPNNFPRARSFPGDVLPYFLGAVTTVGLLDLVDRSPLVLFGLAPLGPAFVDTLSTLVRRGRRRERLLVAHRDHAYQRLARRRSHTFATLTFLGLSGLCAVSLPLALTTGVASGAVMLSVALACCCVVLARIPHDGSLL